MTQERHLIKQPMNPQRTNGGNLHTSRFIGKMIDDVDMDKYRCPCCKKVVIRGRFTSGTRFEVQCETCTGDALKKGGSSLLKQLSGGKGKIYRLFEFQ